MTGLHDIPLPPDTNARDFHCERLSAMMDGALSPDETRFLLRRMEHDDDLADRWSRWQFVGDAMRGHAGRALPADFSHRVGRAIADDLLVDDLTDESSLAVAVGAGVSTRRPLLRWGGGAALAASVALAALLGTRALPPQDNAVMAIEDASAASTPLPLPPGLVPKLPASSQPGSDLARGPSVADAGAAIVLASVVAATGERRNLHPRVLARSEALTVSAAASSASPQAVQSLATIRNNPPKHALSPDVLHKGADAAEVASAADGGRVISEAGMAAKPWPRALVPGTLTGGSVVAGYESEGLAVPRQPVPHPFQRLQPRSVPVMPVLSAETASHTEDAAASP